MKYLIKYRKYFYPRNGKLEESLLTFKVRAFEIENGFISIFTVHNETPIPDIRINVNDVLTIEPID